MQPFTLIILGLLAGVIIPIQTVFNSQLGKTTGHPLLATMCIFIIGGLICLISLLLYRPDLPKLTNLYSAPVWTWFGGIISVTYVLLVVFLAPRLGISTVTCLVLVGQLFCSVTIDHFGIFGSQLQPLTYSRLAGILMMSGGIILVCKT